MNRLIASLDAAGIAPGANVYAELGSTWWNVMRDPTQAAHVLGKLIARVGEDRVLWGTDSIWYGTPQDQIQAFRTFEISDAVPGRVRLPALTDEVKRQDLRRQRGAALRRRARHRDVHARTPPRSRSTAPRSRRSISVRARDLRRGTRRDAARTAWRDRYWNGPPSTPMRWAVM